ALDDQLAGLLEDDLVGAGRALPVRQEVRQAREGVPDPAEARLDVPDEPADDVATGTLERGARAVGAVLGPLQGGLGRALDVVPLLADAGLEAGHQVATLAGE